MEFENMTIKELRAEINVKKRYVKSWYRVAAFLSKTQSEHLERACNQIDEMEAEIERRKHERKNLQTTTTDHD